MEGWIKLHRQFLDWEWYNDIPTKVLFVHLLLKANSTDNNWRGNFIKRGQFFTSLGHLSDETGLTVKQIRGSLQKLKNTKEITIEGASNGTMVTISKYDSYQSIQNTKGKPGGKRRANEGQTKGNNKEEEEYKEVDTNVSTWRDDFDIYLKECKSEYSRLYSDQSFISEQSRLNPNVNIKLSIEKGYTNFWGTELGWKHKKKSKSKEIDWKATIINSIEMNKVYYTRDELANL